MIKFPAEYDPDSEEPIELELTEPLLEIAAAKTMQEKLALAERYGIPVRFIGPGTTWDLADGPYNPDAVSE